MRERARFDGAPLVTSLVGCDLEQREIPWMALLNAMWKLKREILQSTNAVELFAV